MLDNLEIQKMLLKCCGNVAEMLKMLDNLEIQKMLLKCFGNVAEMLKMLDSLEIQKVRTKSKRPQKNKNNNKLRKCCGNVENVG